MNLNPTHRGPCASIVLALALSLSSLAGWEQLQAAETLSDQVGAVASDAQKKVEEAGQTATTQAKEIWRRIDEQRLVNRTPDQIVAWVIMGLLAGGLLRRFSKLTPAAMLPLGLLGAFLGGIVANVTRFDLGLGPVLIRYEELLASLVGGVLLMLVVRWIAARRAAKKQPSS
jgi:hypothetical protein